MTRFFHSVPSVAAWEAALAAARFVATVHGMDAEVAQEPPDLRRRELEEVMHLVAAEVAKDGGRVRLGTVEYGSGRVEVVLSGACGSCALTGGTLEDGIKRVLTQRLDWVRDVVGVVEEDSSARGRGGWMPKREF